MKYSSVSSTIQLCLITVCSLVVLSRAQKQRLFFKDIDSGLTQKEVFAPIGGNAVLECEAGGTPGPLIHWLRNGQRINQGGLLEVEEASSHEITDRNRRLSTLQLSSTKSRLFIDCVSAADAGLYVCVAETPTKRTAIDYILKVDTKKISRVRRESNRHNLNKHFHGDHRTQTEERCFKQHIEPAQLPARIYMWTLHRVEVEGADVQLYCRPTGSGSAKVTWFDRNGEAITKRDSQYEVLETGDLMVKSISWAENMGLYRCVVENGLGTDEVETFLYPAGQEKKRY